MASDRLHYPRRGVPLAGRIQKYFYPDLLNPHCIPLLASENSNLCILTRRFLCSWEMGSWLEPFQWGFRSSVPYRSKIPSSYSSFWCSACLDWLLAENHSANAATAEEVPRNGKDRHAKCVMRTMSLLRLGTIFNVARSGTSTSNSSASLTTVWQEAPQRI